MSASGITTAMTIATRRHAATHAGASYPTAKSALCAHVAVRILDGLDSAGGFNIVWANTHMMPVETINWDKHDVVECDDRGRATLGSEYAGERVFVYVAELPDVDDVYGERMDEDTERVLGKMLAWARRNDIDTMTHLLDPENGVVTDKSGERHRSPYSVANQGEYDS